MQEGLASGQTFEELEVFPPETAMERLADIAEHDGDPKFAYLSDHRAFYRGYLSRWDEKGTIHDR